MSVWGRGDLSWGIILFRHFYLHHLIGWAFKPFLLLNLLSESGTLWGITTDPLFQSCWQWPLCLKWGRKMGRNIKRCKNWDHLHLQLGTIWALTVLAHTWWVPGTKNMYDYLSREYDILENHPGDLLGKQLASENNRWQDCWPDSDF